MKALVVAHSDAAQVLAVLRVRHAFHADAFGLVNELEGHGKGGQDQHTLPGVARDVLGNREFNQRLAKPGICEHADATFSHCAGNDLALKVEGAVWDKDRIESMLRSRMPLCGDE